MSCYQELRARPHDPHGFVVTGKWRRRALANLGDSNVSQNNARSRSSAAIGRGHLI